jgi:hypothetical protein
MPDRLMLFKAIGEKSVQVIRDDGTGRSARTSGRLEEPGIVTKRIIIGPG